MRFVRAAASALASLLVLVVAQVGLAKPEACEPEGPWVLARLQAPLPAKLDATGMLERLGVELTTRGWSLCTDAPPQPAPERVATAAFRGAQKKTITIDIEVVGRSASKRASRDIDLSTVPRDSSATIVALAADEMMRAAWDELALVPAEPAAVHPIEDLEPGARQPDPPRFERAPDAAATPPPERGLPWALGLRGGAELWSGGLAFFGGDGAVAISVSERVRLEVHGGARASLPARGPDGTVEAQAACARVGASIALLRPGPTTQLGVATRLGAYAVRMTGQPTGEARGEADTSGAFSLETGPTFSVELGRNGTALVVDATVAGALRGVAARDGGAIVTGLSGVAFTTSVGVLAGLP